MMKAKFKTVLLCLAMTFAGGMAMAQCSILQLDDYSFGAQPLWIAGENATSTYISTYQAFNGTVDHKWALPAYGTITSETVNQGSLTRTWIEVEWDNVPQGGPAYVIDNIEIKTFDAYGCYDTQIHTVIIIKTTHPAYSYFF
ncbi:MAG: hypothetical protein AAF502_25305 [Bacteroidota bacterium]